MPAREERTRSPSTSPQNSPASSAVPVSQMPDLSASHRARLLMRATTERALFLTTSSRRSEGSPALSVLPPSKRPGFPASPWPALDARFVVLLASLRPSGICPPRHPWYAHDRTDSKSFHLLLRLQLLLFQYFPLLFYQLLQLLLLLMGQLLLPLPLLTRELLLSLPLLLHHADELRLLPLLLLLLALLLLPHHADELRQLFFQLLPSSGCSRAHLLAHS